MFIGAPEATLRDTTGHTLLQPPRDARGLSITGDAATAAALGAAFGTSAEFWRNLEIAYRLAQAGPPDPPIAAHAGKVPFTSSRRGSTRLQKLFGATHIIPNHGRGPLHFCGPGGRTRTRSAFQLHTHTVGCEHSVERSASAREFERRLRSAVLQGQGADCMLQDGECSRLLIIADAGESLSRRRPGVVINKRSNVVQQTTRRSDHQA